GNMTRLAQFYLSSEKAYEGVIRFGFATDTYDSDGAPTGKPQECSLALDQLRQLSQQVQGVIKQTPPPISAKKVRGVPTYKLARKKKGAWVKAVKVEIKDFEVSRLENSRAHFRARVASGTYVRSLALELGKLAGCGAHLESLRRTAVAEFETSDAHTLEQVE